MKKSSKTFGYFLAAFFLTVISGCAAGPGQQTAETEERIKVAAASFDEAAMVDCLMAGTMKRVGGMTYLTPGRLMRTSAVECRVRGGEYDIANLASGEISLSRWQPVAEQGDAEAQYYVATIYRFGIGRPVDYGQAAKWYQQASAQGLNKATLELAFLYEKGWGVEQDRLKSLNLAREASGLDDDLEYAENLRLAKEEARIQIDALTAALEQRNQESTQMRVALEEARSALQSEKNEVTAVRLLAAQLDADLFAAQNRVGGVDTAAVATLQRELAATQAQLAGRETDIAALSAAIESESALLIANLQSAQAESLQLRDQVVLQNQEDSSIRAELESARTSLQRAESELGDLQARYQQDVSELVADRESLAISKTDLSAEAVKSTERFSQELTTKTEELDRRQVLITGLERETDQLRLQVVDLQRASQKNSSETDDELELARAEIMEMRNRLTETQAELTAAQNAYESESAQRKIEAERLAELQQEGEKDSAAIESMESAMQMFDLELENRQARIDELEGRTEEYSTKINRLAQANTERVREQDSTIHGLRADLAGAEAEVLRTTEELTKAQSNYAREKAELLANQATLREELALSTVSAASEVQTIEQQVAAREQRLRDKNQQIAQVETQLADQKQIVASLQKELVTRTAGGPDSGSRAEPIPDVFLTVDEPILDEVRRTLPLGNYHALVIGNADYKYYDDLKTPAGDAETVAQLLQGRYGFKVNLMVNATRDSIAAALHDYGQFLGPTDNLLIYYAGHGQLIEDDDRKAKGYWLGVDALPDVPDTWLPDHFIVEKVDRIAAKHVLIVADSCFSGVFAQAGSDMRLKGGVPGSARTESIEALKIYSQYRARLFLASGGDQPVLDSGGGTHSVFANHFIRALRTNNIPLTSEGLYAELYSGVVKDTQRLGFDQVPQYDKIANIGHTAGEFLFVPETAVLASEFGYAEPVASSFVGRY
jgi:hypothetical protein